jgi:hypothetical protein
MANHPFPFSWRALLQAPLVIFIPLAFFLDSGATHPFVAFGVFAVISYVFTLSVVACLLIPALWLVSRVAIVRTWLPPVIGGLFAAFIFLASDYSFWCSSGVDSGPPATPYSQWIAKSWFTTDPFVVIAFGVVTAAAYNFLAKKKATRSSQDQQSNDWH